MMPGTMNLEELGTTIYDRADEVADLVELLDNSVCDVPGDLWGQNGESSYHHASNLRLWLKLLGERLNPMASDDSLDRNGPPIELKKTDRGFKYGEFDDADDNACAIQESSLATEERIWLGTFGSRMHLTRPMASALLPHLKRFVETGRL